MRLSPEWAVDQLEFTGDDDLSVLQELIIEDDQQMQVFGKQLARLLSKGDLVLLNGPLGAGKTTMTRGIGKALGAIGTIQSPTFVLARTHQTENKVPFVHVDAYRLGSAVELDDLDIDFERSIVVIEWPRDFTQGVADDWLEVELSRDKDGDARLVKISGFGKWQNREMNIDLGN
jgi:tRNA threonylcarbamoyl adenosine modification protein YjeE